MDAIEVSLIANPQANLYLPEVFDREVYAVVRAAERTPAEVFLHEVAAYDDIGGDVACDARVCAAHQHTLACCRDVVVHHANPLALTDEDALCLQCYAFETVDVGVDDADVGALDRNPAQGVTGSATAVEVAAIYDEVMRELVERR